MSTDDQYDYKRIYTGSEVNVQFLQEQLEKENNKKFGGGLIVAKHSIRYK